MKEIKTSIKKLSRDEQKKIMGADANQHCFTLQGSWGVCKTSALCNLDLPICEAV
jgi:hypothetical protein